MTALRCIHELVEDQVRRTPTAPAVAFGGERVSYAELDRRANRLAHHLLRHGVGSGSLVVLFLERSTEMVVAILGVLKAGAAYVPVDPHIPPARLDFTMSDTAAQVVLTQRALAGELARLHARIVSVDDDSLFGSLPEDAPAAVVDPHDLAYVMYTSGSTGTPKGVMVEHAGVSNHLLGMRREYGLDEHDRVLQKTPYTFDLSVWELLLPLVSGASMVVAKPGGHRDADYIADMVASEQVTTLAFVPSMLRLFVAADRAEACASVRQVFCIGEALTRDLQDRYYARFSAPLFNLYGPTEASVAVTNWACSPDDPRPFVPIGAPMDGVLCYVLDDQLRPVAPGEIGELAVGGVAVARGYLNRPDQTTQSFVPSPSGSPAILYRTGDRVRKLPDGTYEYLGRNDHQVKIRGFRVEPSEIEGQLGGVPEVAGAVVMVDDSAAEPRLVAYLELREAAVTVASLRAHLAAFLPDYMIPSAFRVVEAFPLSVNGKLDRHELKSFPYRTLADATSEPARDRVEEVLARAWSDALGLDVGVHDDFFVLGGDSLLAMRLAASAREQGLAITSEEVITLRTVAAVAAAAREGIDLPGQAAASDPNADALASSGEVRLAVADLNANDLATLRQLVRWE